jgi:hypothetical protein
MSKPGDLTNGWAAARAGAKTFGPGKLCGRVDLRKESAKFALEARSLRIGAGITGRLQGDYTRADLDYVAADEDTARRIHFKTKR